MNSSIDCRITVSILALFAVVLFGCTQENNKSNSSTTSSSSKSGEIKKITSQSERNGRDGVSTVLSNTQDIRNSKPKQRHIIKKADIDKGGDSHASQNDVVISDQGSGVAYIAENDGRQYVVHNGKAGNPSSEIQHLRISPDGNHVAYSKSVGNYYQMVSDGIPGNLFIDVYDAVYSPDSRHSAYLAEGLDRAMNIVLDGKTINLHANVISAVFLFSHDSSKLVYHVRQDDGPTAELFMYDLKTGSKSSKRCLDIPVVMNSAKNRIAAVTMINGKQRAIDFDVASAGDERKSALYDAVSLLSLRADGKELAFVAIKGKHQYLVLNGKETILPDNLAVAAPPFFHPGTNEVGVLMKTKERSDNTYYIYQSNLSGNSSRVQSTMIKEPVYGIKKNDLAYVSVKNDGFILVLNGKEGPVFDSVVSPLFTSDGSKLIYRAREGSSRFVVVADITTNEHRRLPSYEMVFPVTISADGKSIAYGVKEEDKFIWKVEKL